jgi:hypothetical protein
MACALGDAPCALADEVLPLTLDAAAGPETRWRAIGEHKEGS